MVDEADIWFKTDQKAILIKSTGILLTDKSFGEYATQFSTTL